MIKRKYVVLALLTLVSILLGGLFYSSIVRANSTVTGYVSVPAVAFVCDDSTKNWTVDVDLCNYEDTDVWFYGEVQIPHGATVTNVTFWWFDEGDDFMYLRLQRYNQSHSQEMVLKMSSGNAGKGSSYDDTIDYATVDNSQYSYFLSVMIPDSATHMDYRFYNAIIEYTLPSEAAVGGLYIPVDKFSLLSPYIALTLTIILAVSMSVAYIKYRKKQ